MKFGIRCKPLQGESLSGYLERLSYRNGFPFLKLIRLLYKTDKQYWKSLSKIDLYSDTNIDIERTAELVDLSVTCLKSMTMQPAHKLYQRFSPTHSLKKSMHNHHRRFCSTCLSEGVTHRLFWQIHEIKICDRHHMKLQSNCTNCGHLQPYLNRKPLTRRYCDNCEYDLAVGSESNELALSASVIDQQLKVYKSWEYLFSREIGAASLFQKDELSYCMSLLYAGQHCEEMFDIKRLGASDNEIQIILSAIRGSKWGNVVTIPRTMKIIHSRSMTLEEFLNLTVPGSYSESVENYVRGVKKEFGPCLAPWCKAYLSKDSMRALHRQKNKILRNNRRYNHLAWCTSCSLIYGRSRNSEWEEVDNYISHGYAVALKLLEEGFSVFDIRKQMGECNVVLLRWFGYFANRKVISNQYIINFLPHTIDQSFLEKMISLDTRPKKARVESAKALFQWKMRDYFYYLGDARVMEHIALSSKKIQPKGQIARKLLLPRVRDTLEYLLKNEIEITFQSVALKLNVSASLMNANGYNQLIKDYRNKQILLFRSKLYHQAEIYILSQSNSPGLFMKNFYRSIGKAETLIDSYFPEFKRWVEDQRVIHKVRYKEYQEKHLAEKARKVIGELAILGEKITQSSLAKHLHVSQKAISTNPYIIEMINAYYINQ
ncbi:TniQ family protein [Paenibacillus sp. sgz500958]|uniref:TniQ family protein n=1 Tax=Paenibacillus sp. sgz500958 TaxID=3242475 RepID=UPI0036D239AA